MLLLANFYCSLNLKCPSYLPSGIYIWYLVPPNPLPNVGDLPELLPSLPQQMPQRWFTWEAQYFWMAYPSLQFSLNPSRSGVVSQAAFCVKYPLGFQAARKPTEYWMVLPFLPHWSILFSNGESPKNRAKSRQWKSAYLTSTFEAWFHPQHQTWKQNSTKEVLCKTKWIKYSFLTPK